MPQENRTRDAEAADAEAPRSAHGGYPERTAPDGDATEARREARGMERHSRQAHDAVGIAGPSPRDPGVDEDGEG